MSEILVLITLNFPEPLVERLRALSPRLQIRVHPARTGQDLPGDLLADVEVLYTLHALPEPASVPNLRWVQFHLSGVDAIVDHPLLHTDVLVTSLSGASAPQLAEYALMGILALGRRVPRMVADKAAKRWAEDRFERFRPVELRGATVGIVGYGSAGREVARLCRAFGATILAVKRDLRSLDDRGYRLKELGDPSADLAERLYPPQAVASMAALCDFLVIAAPLTPETRGMIDRPRVRGAQTDRLPDRPIARRVGGSRRPGRGFGGEETRRRHAGCLPCRAAAGRQPAVGDAQRAPFAAHRRFLRRLLRTGHGVVWREPAPLPLGSASAEPVRPAARLLGGE